MFVEAVHGIDCAMSDAVCEVASPTRVRRATAKAVNYSKEQEFSDAEDLFEDESDEEAKPRRGAGRIKVKATGGGGGRNNSMETSTVAKGDHFADEEDNVFQSQHPVYTEKGYDPNLPPLRERFSFLPEYEEDGSPKIELIVGRRPVDDKEETRIKGDDNDIIEDDEDDEDEEDEEEELGTSRSRRKAAPATPSKKKGKDTSPKKKRSGNTPESTSVDQVIEYEYLVKYKGRSYLHLEWKTGADLESMNKSAKGIYRRYVKKLSTPGIDLEELESPEVDPSYVIPEKVLDEADQEISEELTDKELLKWEQQRANELEVDDDGEDDELESPSKVSAEPTNVQEEEVNKGTNIFPPSRIRPPRVQHILT
jgi:hypothetical protein